MHHDHFVGTSSRRKHLHTMCGAVLKPPLHAAELHSPRLGHVAAQWRAHVYQMMASLSEAERNRFLQRVQANPTFEGVPQEEPAPPAAEEPKAPSPTPALQEPPQDVGHGAEGRRQGEGPWCQRTSTLRWSPLCQLCRQLSPLRPRLLFPLLRVSESLRVLPAWRPTRQPSSWHARNMAG